MAHLVQMFLNDYGGVNMAVLNIRDFPEDLMRQLKAKAALEGKTLRALTIELLKKAVKKQGG
jgi:plasmid stability protein